MKKLFQNNLNISINSKLLSGGITFLSNLIHTRLLNIDDIRGPLNVTWLCTYKCNANCKFCSTHQLSKKYPDSLNKQRAMEIAQEIGINKTWIVGFTGGEALLWPHLFDVIRILKKYKIVVYIITNGILLKKFAEEIIESGIDMVVISLDSFSALEHDNNRGKNGVFNAAIEGIKEIKKRRRNKPKIKSTTVFSKQSYPKIQQIIDYFSEIVDECGIQPISTGYVDHPHQIDKQQEKLFIPDFQEEEKLQKSFSELQKKYPSFNNFYFNNIPNYLFHYRDLLKVKCWSPFLRLQIRPQGEVTHCVASSKYSSIVGDLRKMTLMESWNSLIIKKHREEIRRHQNKCICWSRDTAFNAVMYTMPLMNRLPVLNKKNYENIID